MLLLDALENILDKSATIPLSGRIMVNKEELLEIIKDIRIKLPDEIKQAQWIKEERHKILIEAKKEAEALKQDTEEKYQKVKDERQRIIAEAEREAEIVRQEAGIRLQNFIDESEVVKKANEQAREIIVAAQQDAKKIRLGSRAYADDILADLERQTVNLCDMIKANRDELKNKRG